MKFNIKSKFTNNIMNNNINVEETKVVVSNIINRLISEKFVTPFKLKR